MPKKAKHVAVIDVELVVVRTDDVELAIKTANKVQIEPQIDTQEAITLVKLGKVLAQKPPKNTITAQQITLTDNVFIPEFVVINQGGTIETDADTGEIIYKPPFVGSGDEGKIFELDVYGACYDAAGKITKYEKTTYPNCQGSMISETIEDNVFRVSEYTIRSAAEEGEPPYVRTYVKTLPTITEDTDGTEQTQSIYARREPERITGTDPGTGIEVV